MGYAIKSDKSWRAVQSGWKLELDEMYSEVMPVSSAIPEKETIIFNKPVVAPDFITQSRDIKSKPKDALDEAVLEAKKAHGNSKSLDLITRSIAIWADEMEKRMDKIEKQLKVK